LSVESLAASKTGLRHLQLMSTLTGFEHLDVNRQVGVGALYEDAKERKLPRESVTGDLHALQDRGWLWFEASAAGIQTVVLNQAGVDAAEEFQALQTDPRRRTLEIRDAALHWLYDRHLVDDDSGLFADFLKSPNAHFLGEPYSEAEVNRAMQWLLDGGYIKGIKAYGTILARPMITTKGQRVVESGRSVNAVEGVAGVTNNVSISGSQGVNFAWNSSDVIQSNTMTQEQVEAVERILGSVRAFMIPAAIGVAEETSAEGQEVADEVEAEIRSATPNSGKVKALLLKLIDLAATGTVRGGVDALNGMMQQGIAGL